MASCPECGQTGIWAGQSGLITEETQRLSDHYTDTNGHSWQVGV